MSTDTTTAPAQRLGIITDESIETYHASAATSHSKLECLRDLDRGPQRYLQTYILKTLPGFQGNESTAFGSAFDAFLLEEKIIYTKQPATYYGPESQKKDAQLVEKPWNNNAGPCCDWHAANAGKIILTAGEIRLMEAMKVAVEKNPDAAALLLGGKPQITFRMGFKWFNAQVRPDKYHANGVTLSTGAITAPVIADLKTAEDLDRFEGNRKSLGYDRQAAMYCEVVRQVLAIEHGVDIDEIPMPEFYFVVVFKSAPVDSIVFKMSGEDMAAATEEVIDDLKWLHTCYERGEWPGSMRGINTLPKLWRKERKELWG